MRGVTATALSLAISIVLAAAIPAPAAQAQPVNTVTYRIQPGDTLWSLARRFGTTADRLAALNGISPEAVLQIGRPLRVPAAAPVLSPARPAAVSPARSAPAAPVTVIHHVQAGDTLWKLSRRYETTPERLAALNGISVEATLQIGQPLKVPARPSAAPPQNATPAQNASTPAQSAPPAESATSTQDSAASDQVTPAPASSEAAPQTPPQAPPVGDDATSGPRRARLPKLPSRGAQWMSTIVALSTRYLGAPYRWGGTSPSGFDCSGFLNFVFERTGVDLPRTTYEMFRSGMPVPREELKTGDIVFFETVSPGPSHAGIYLGDGRFIHSSSGFSRVTITPLDHPYYVPRYLGARRF